MLWQEEMTKKHGEKKGKQAQTSCRHGLVANRETISEATENKTEGDDI